MGHTVLQMTVLFLRPDLAKPASTLYTHNLSGVLEAAIRATNAQFEDPDIIKRLDCRLLEVILTFTHNLIAISNRVSSKTQKRLYHCILGFGWRFRLGCFQFVLQSGWAYWHCKAILASSMLLS